MRLAARSPGASLAAGCLVLLGLCGRAADAAVSASPGPGRAGLGAAGEGLAVSARDKVGEGARMSSQPASPLPGGRSSAGDGLGGALGLRGDRCCLGQGIPSTPGGLGDGGLNFHAGKNWLTNQTCGKSAGKPGGGCDKTFRSFYSKDLNPPPPPAAWLM